MKVNNRALYRKGIFCLSLRLYRQSLYCSSFVGLIFPVEKLSELFFIYTLHVFPSMLFLKTASEIIAVSSIIPGD